MADIIGSYERLPNDAVRAVAVAKRREYMGVEWDVIISFRSHRCVYTKRTLGLPVAAEK
jgi:hypothetical protein